MIDIILARAQVGIVHLLEQVNQRVALQFAELISELLLSVDDLELPPVLKTFAAYPEGLVLVTGCAHPGIVDIVKLVKQEFPGKPIAFVGGGFHLRSTPEPEIREIADRYMERILALTFSDDQLAEMRRNVAGVYADLFTLEEQTFITRITEWLQQRENKDMIMSRIWALVTESEPASFFAAEGSPDAGKSERAGDNVQSDVVGDAGDEPQE